MTIRQATSQDIDALTQVHAASFDQTWSAATIAQFLTSAKVFVSTPRPYGFIPNGFIIVQAAADEAEIITLAVMPDARGQGLASRLMAYAIKELQNDRCERLFLEVATDNHAALALYKRFDFQPQGLRKGYYQRLGGHRVDALVMSLDMSIVADN
jgi:[ribosomal protein S18]-alanine N-acetyltransferase